MSIHKVIQKLVFWQSWRPKFSPGACTGAEADPIRNRVDASGWKIWDANFAKKPIFESPYVYLF